MPNGMEADTPQLITEAGNFDRISGDLTAILGAVEGTASVLSADLQGEAAGPAVQAALQRFSEASRQQIDLLTQISENIHTSGIDYDSADQQNADALAAQMQQNL
ncbi:WXG100 family type VII secretion target [Mycolicibacterium iranicum]|uniref:ESAT-6-like protein n=1 Tax=Mycolicibacterium iranicum TaxID=912594 RepID=A0A839Q8L6_MYCIR|nr:WXG100 family type VII secretion target [Mycolicibacterium iranicum]MBB2988951.1 WXG100 family type VII secretion target [Mycolicibacterium iranicum]